jgi:periplasmic protein CpxP/Spy
MKILKIFLILSSLYLFLNADDGHKKYKHSYKNLDFLHLNSIQLENIKTILIDFKKEYKEFYEYKEEQEDLLEDLIENKEFDEKQYLQILTDIKIKSANLEVKRLKKIHAILDEKQKKEFAQYLEEWEIE